MSQLGLSLDHAVMEADLLWAATPSIIQTCDNKLRAVVPDNRNL
jgi:hypothetical protein